MKSKGSALVIVISVLLGLCLLVAGYFYLQNQSLINESVNVDTSIKTVPTTKSVDAAPAPLPSPVDTTSWKIYTFTGTGFTIKYPPSWHYYTGPGVTAAQGQVLLEGKEGLVNVLWGGGFGGGPCVGKRTTVETGAGTLEMCTNPLNDGTIFWDAANDGQGTFKQKPELPMKMTGTIKAPLSENEAIVRAVFKSFAWE